MKGMRSEGKGREMGTKKGVGGGVRGKENKGEERERVAEKRIRQVERMVRKEEKENSLKE